MGLSVFPFRYLSTGKSLHFSFFCPLSIYHYHSSSQKIILNEWLARRLISGRIGHFL
jgi:hypothetical protein